MIKQAISPWRICPRCAQNVYKSRWDHHNRLCLLIESRAGSPATLAAAFHADPSMTPGSLARSLPWVSAEFVEAYLTAGGVTVEELRERRGPAAGPSSRHCTRCTIRLDAAGVRPSPGDASLCAWCAEETARV